MDLIRATVLGILLAIIIVAYVRAKQGCFFKPMFRNDFPEELKPYIRENPMRYRAGAIAPFLERYRKTKKREGNFFSLERFLDGERELMRMKKKNRR